MHQARLRAAGEERVCRVLSARRRRQPKRVRHELSAVVEREARVSGEAAREVGREFALVRAARRARRRGFQANSGPISGSALAGLRRCPTTRYVNNGACG